VLVADLAVVRRGHVVEARDVLDDGPDLEMGFRLQVTGSGRRLWIGCPRLDRGLGHERHQEGADVWYS
jgi:hypothetical protein